MATVVKPLGQARLAPRLVLADITFDANGDATVTAAELGLQNIQWFSGGVWGGTDNVVASVYSKTAFSADGVSSIDLLAYETTATTTSPLAITCRVAFFGD